MRWGNSSDTLPLAPSQGLLRRRTAHRPTFSVDARQLAASAGLTPQERTSGSSVHRAPRLAKTGKSRLRCARSLPTIVAMRHHPAVHALAERLRARGKRPMVIVGAAMRKLLHLIYGVLKSGTPFDPAVARAA